MARVIINRRSHRSNGCGSGLGWRAECPTFMSIGNMLIKRGKRGAGLRVTRSERSALRYGSFVSRASGTLGSFRLAERRDIRIPRRSLFHLLGHRIVVVERIVRSVSRSSIHRSARARARPRDSSPRDSRPRARMYLEPSGEHVKLRNSPCAVHPLFCDAITRGESS